MPTSNIKNIAIIGAGSAGVISAIMLKKMGFHCTLFDMRQNVGGLWNYHDKTPIYKSLVTNLPRQIMAISPKHQFDNTLPSFVTHQDMLAYIQNLWTQYNLQDQTYFSTKVLSATPESESPFCQWSVTTQNMATETIQMKTFDACLVCNGHYDTPVYADIQGIEHFKGIQQHARDYDNPVPYTRKKVVVIGAGPSATDLAREITTSCTSIDISSRQLQGDIQRYDNLALRGGISHIDAAGSVHFTDGGDAIMADIIIHCTGYEYAFDFLSSDIVTVHQHQVKSLYKQIFHIQKPSLAFIGIPFDVVPFLMFKYQAQYVAQIFAEQQQLPSEEQRYKSLEDETQFIRNFGFPVTKKHCLSKGLLWPYLDDLVTLSGLKTDEETSLLALYQQVYNQIGKPPYIGGSDHYRQHNFKVDFDKCEWQKITPLCKAL